MRVKKAVIPAAGLGTRFLPATKAQPKEMLPIVDKPVIQYIVEEAVASGIEDILIITGRGKRSIEDHFDKSYELEHTLADMGKVQLAEQLEHISTMVNLYYVRQKEPKGLGHAIYCAKGFIGNEPFAVMLGDDLIYSPQPLLQQIIQVYERYRCSVVTVQNVADDDVSKYGIVKPEILQSKRIFKITDLVEKPALDQAPSNLAIIGRYILTPEIFEILGKLAPGSNNEIQLTDALRILNKFQPIIGYLCDGKRYDTGNVLGYFQANIEYALHRSELKGELKKYLELLIASLDSAETKRYITLGK